jgi:hypothetical protein
VLGSGGGEHEDLAARLNAVAHQELGDDRDLMLPVPA